MSFQLESLSAVWRHMRRRGNWGLLKDLRAHDFPISLEELWFPSVQYSALQPRCKAKSLRFFTSKISPKYALNFEPARLFLCHVSKKQPQATVKTQEVIPATKCGTQFLLSPRCIRQKLWPAFTLAITGYFITRATPRRSLRKITSAEFQYRVLRNTFLPTVLHLFGRGRLARQTCNGVWDKSTEINHFGTSAAACVAGHAALSLAFWSVL